MLTRDGVSMGPSSVLALIPNLYVTRRYYNYQAKSSLNFTVPPSGFLSHEIFPRATALNVIVKDTQPGTPTNATQHATSVTNPSWR
jgi:hypothetical protein